MQKENVLKAIAGFKLNHQISKSVPTLINPYSTLLKEITEKKRLYKQSEWGDITDFNCDENVCESPMCIAGHLVNFAGDIGYKLQKQFGWAKAAGIIHLKTHPDVPVFNFFITSNEIGLAYIEMMAAYEQRPDQTQTFNQFLDNLLKN
jgi:hypothetical protein